MARNEHEGEDIQEVKKSKKAKRVAWRARRGNEESPPRRPRQEKRIEAGAKTCARPDGPPPPAPFSRAAQWAAGSGRLMIPTRR